ncbi:MAG: phytanoyl-CoA dioxygenase family protein [Acidimicrobiia bacterium]|nr:phytanoyl-CoA dioxygenase family protein [Acidimicrobiia bacterium]
MTVTDSATDADAEARARYYAAGERRARELPNRGPIRYTDEGCVHPDIVEAYWEHGFYIFTGVVEAKELADVRAEVDEVLDRAPYPTRSSPVDRHGRPALGVDMARNPWQMAAPLSDPVGGTSANHGRHPVKMYEPMPAGEAPAEVPFLVGSGLELMDSFLRVYGHPDLLRVAEAINGEDFTPFTDVLFVKLPGLGPSVAWHQDGQLHWDSPDWDAGSHGFNLQVQLYGSTPANGVWVVPGSHRLGKIDIAALVEANGGSERLPDAVPLVCDAGDCVITNRQILHASFANTSSELRVTVNFGFHRYSSVIGQTGVLSGRGNTYDADYIARRCRCIPVAIDARAQRYPDEDPYLYKPLADALDENRFDEETRRTVLKDYALFDLGI